MVKLERNLVASGKQMSPRLSYQQGRGAAFSGTHVSSIHRLKDTNNEEGAFFIFGDLSFKFKGIWTLQFNLLKMEDGECAYITSCKSSPFKVQSHKSWVGMQESTPLTRQFTEQGVRLRLRNEPRTLLGNRGLASERVQVSRSPLVEYELTRNRRHYCHRY
jgi:hypothetical protein